jgi:hypothetical protein
MSPHAASELKAYAADEVVILQSGPEGPNVLERLVEFFNRVVARVTAVSVRSGPEAQFLWNVPPARLRSVKSATVYCVELPVSNPVAMLEAYRRSGVASDHVVFVGDALTLSDDAYDWVTRKGALVHEISKKGRREKTERDLKSYYSPARPERKAAASHPLTYKPGPPKVTAEQLQELIDAVGRARR